MNQDKYRYDKLLETLCSELDKIIENDIFKDAKYKKNVTAISSFLEFLKSGAEVTTGFDGNSKVNFIIEMK